MPFGRTRPVDASGTGGFFGSRVAVVTGAGSGIGRALAVELAARGARLAVSDIDTTGLDETARLCLQTGAQVHQAVVDVSDWDAMSSYATAVLEEFGRVELVFCVAGIIHTGDLVASDPADVERVLAVNVMGVVHTAKLFLPHLIAAGPGRLVMVSSGFGLMAAPYYSAYSASKFAVRALADSVRQEMALAGHRVVVTCVYPGGVRTPIMRNGRYATGVSRDAVVDGFDRRMARTTPEDAAIVILRGVARGRPRVLVGRDVVAVSAFVHAAGATYPGLLARGARAARLLSGFRTRRGA